MTDQDEPRRWRAAVSRMLSDKRSRGKYNPVMSPDKVLDFWFRESTPGQWFAKDEAFDARIREHFLDIYEAALRGETEAWRATPRGRLAEIILVDQFPRNMFRGTSRAFEGDALAQRLAQEAVAARAQRGLSSLERQFLYMPYMHSESKELHRKAVRLFASLLPWRWTALFFEFAHKRVIDRFGRYPHRNAILGRESTDAEKAFLEGHKGW